MKYLVTYTETFSKTMIVEADSADEACDIMDDAVACGDVILFPDDYCDYDIDVQDCNANDERWFETLNR